MITALNHSSILKDLHRPTIYDTPCGVINNQAHATLVALLGSSDPKTQGYWKTSITQYTMSERFSSTSHGLTHLGNVLLRRAFSMSTHGPTLARDCPHSRVAGIGVDNEQLCRVGKGQVLEAGHPADG
ncbi:unnamed protein product [Lota lota]